jgi:hypothetical protein
MKITKEYLDRLEDYKSGINKILMVEPVSIRLLGAFCRLFGYLDALKDFQELEEKKR